MASDAGTLISWIVMRASFSFSVHRRSYPARIGELLDQVHQGRLFAVELRMIAVSALCRTASTAASGVAAGGAAVTDWAWKAKPQSVIASAIAPTGHSKAERAGARFTSPLVTERSRVSRPLGMAMTRAPALAARDSRAPRAASSKLLRVVRGVRAAVEHRVVARLAPAPASRPETPPRRADGPPERGHRRAQPSAGRISMADVSELMPERGCNSATPNGVAGSRITGRHVPHVMGTVT